MDTPTQIDSTNPAHARLLEARVQCGFPSPAEDHAQSRIDLNDVLILHPESTFFMRSRGPSMHDAGIDDGDYVVVDRALEARHRDIVLAVVDGDYTIKYLHRRAGRTRLLPANPTFPPIEFRDGQLLVVWGVVTCIIKLTRPVANRRAA